ncbi:hypothetical protein ACIGBL_34155 [Streptomyces sp. NPDC085614]|uniref:hypothetical protein n=1 Tax=Streptomyces sp. NPDC085614 TaxID=3365733 RepID=UPI0037D839CE
MSIIVKSSWLRTTRQRAWLSTLGRDGHSSRSPSVTSIPKKAVLEWECLMVGGSFEELVEAGEPRIVAGQDNDGCVVFALSPRLSAALTDAEHASLRDVALSWIRLRAEDGEVIGTQIADAIVGDLAALVSSARLQNQSRLLLGRVGAQVRSQIMTAAAVAVPRKT